MSTILFATDYYPPFTPGGAEWSNAAWAQALVRRGHRVVVVTPNYGAPARETSGGVLVVRLPFPVGLAGGQREAPWIAHRNPFFHAWLGAWLWRIARAQGADLVHAQSKATVVGSWLAARALGRPFYATIRDLGYLCPLGMCPLFETAETYDCGARQYIERCAPFFLEHYVPGARGLRRLRVRVALAIAWIDQLLRRAALGRADRIIAVSAGILAVHSDRLVDRRRARVVHTLPPSVAVPGRDEAASVRRRLGIGPGPLVLCAGRLSLGKGTPVFLAALDAVREEAPDARFALAGRGEWPIPRRDDLHALGSVDQRDLFALYHAADVVVVPSSWPEPLSRVLLEAMRLGRPVVATAVGGSPEAVEDGETGLLVPKGDAKALGAAIARLLRDPELRERMGAAAARRAARVFDETRLVDALLDAYGLPRSAA